jgi:hypothetical protein
MSKTALQSFTNAIMDIPSQFIVNMMVKNGSDFIVTEIVLNSGSGRL